MKAKILGLLAVGLLAGPMTANATLIGDTATIAYEDTGFPAANTSMSVVVGAGAEATCPSATVFCGTSSPVLFPGESLDIGAAYITVIFSNTQQPFPAASFVGFRFQDLDFLIPSIVTGVNVSISGLTGFTASDVTFTDDSVSLNLQGAQANGTATINLLTRPITNAVPEPGTLALLGLGLAGLGLSRRRKAN